MKRIPFILVALVLFFSACHQADFDVAESTASAPYSDAESDYNENQRKVIKTAQIALQVDHLEQSIVQLKAFLKPINGYVYNYEIRNHKYEIDQFQKNMDSSVSVEKVSPEGQLSVRIPIQQADTFINYVLQSKAQISSLKIHDDDITENLWEKKQIANVYTQSGKAQKRKGTSTNISYDNNTSINGIKAKALAAQMDYKTNYLWFDITMSAKPFYTSTTTIAAKNYRTPMHISLANALIKGWHICADIIIGIITIWPILLLIGLCLLVYKRYRPQRPKAL